jgi:hypothetical protein
MHGWTLVVVIPTGLLSPITAPRLNLSRRSNVMLKSDIVEVDGVFVGAAILQPNGSDRAFYAAHGHVQSLHGQVMRSLAEVRAQAAEHFRRVERSRKSSNAPEPHGLQVS